ncbi:MAG: hypothetical protein OEZ01_03800, partial [Candidatus Heimdallarchaeota archaeon]|nr:hypothetical protein [Candidatus Heimdallarchaeota archaeon]
MTTYVSDRDEVSVKNNFNQNSVIFGLFVNFIALYLFFETAIFYYMAIIFGVLTIISIAMNMVSTEKIDNSIQKRYRTKPTDILKLFSKHMSINKKSITVILLGMIISVIILSQSILMVSSYNQKVIEDNLDVENVVAFELSSNFNYEQSTIQSWKSKVDVQSTERLSQYGLEFKNSSQSSSMSLSIITGGIMSDDYGSYIISTYARAHNYSIDIYNILNQLPTYNQTFDYNPSDTLVILSPWDNSTNFIGKNEMNILLEEPYKESNTTTTFKNMTLPYTHVWQLSEVDINYLMQKNLQIDFYSSLILLPEVQFWDLASIFYTELTTNQRFYYDIITINRIYMNTPLIIDTSYDEIMSGLEKFTNNMINWANQQVSGGSGNSEPWFGGAYGNSPLLLKMYEFQENYLNIAKIMMLILYPLILLSIYFVFFLLTLTDNQRKKQIAILKSRGITDTQLYFIMFFEIIIGMILSIIIGMELSKYWTDYSLNSLEFSNAKYKFENVNLIIPSSWYYKVPILTAIFSFDLHILSVSTIMNVKIQEGEDAFERKPPFWQRFHLDKIIFIASVAFWSMLN